jgi:hypothetical protein
MAIAEKDQHMATRDELVQSKYMKCSDLGGKEVTVKIRLSNVEVLKTLDGRENTKCVLYFELPYGKKGLPLNVTNLDSVYDITGVTDTEDFPGHKIVLYPAKATMGGKIHDAIRIRAVEAKGAKKGKAAKDSPPDDGVPFNDSLDGFADDEAA